MYYQVAQEVFDKLPTACFGAVAVRGLDNTRQIPELEEMLQENIKVCEAYFADKKPKETPDIVPYREAFRALGINPNKYLCSIEALLTRIAKGKGFPCINAVVDLGNAISIGHRLPIGAHDIDSLDEGLDVRLARPATPLLPLAKPRRRHRTRARPFMPQAVRFVPAAGPGGRVSAARLPRRQSRFCSPLTASPM